MNITTLQSNLDFIKSIYFYEEWKDEECRGDILEAIEECNEKIEEALGKSMHRLCKHRPSVEAVEKVVKKFPSTLSYEDNYWMLPIETCATNEITSEDTYNNNGIEYVPILAKEGMKHKVGGEDARGGLLKAPTYIINILQGIVSLGEYDGPYLDSDDNDDEKRVNVLKELRQKGLLLKTDIQKYSLLQFACHTKDTKRFEYLVQWEPDALVNTKYWDEFMVNSRFIRRDEPRLPLIHCFLQTSDFDILKNLLEAGFRHFPNNGGLLFIENDEGTTAFDAACANCGTEECMNMLRDILSPSCDYPILHYALIKAPQHKDIFMEKFPWAYQLKDHNGRSLQQAILAAGPDVMNANKILFATLTDDQIRSKDPITTLYPFAAMAVGEHADLEKVFYLLRQHPSVLDQHANSDSSILSRKRRRSADKV
ncbi:hypothetical protein CTEN210_13656 [Chaetoceros tenuissimus]|uniref:Ankyrin repeat protein n=1 Tax=Chaetoceros tenuissimus TaxID=426638 RepID=A0AAD3D5L0_9STRA|nr:hypothetical protein CTEN210_13656 [Chaetoceros tenuissimus]